MKSRSHHHRLQSTADDWVDESWTVDCVCGVNFDDGEEMVNCDECGVWVHTRCSRYVKGDDVFVCHKCKTKNSRSISATAIATSNEAQKETEVAQFLVELPTKTVMMGTSLAANANVTTTANNHNPPCRRPFRLWTDIPMEERVHVQGIPGGDPSLFHGLSTVFTPQLWKSAGYIPKSFSFQYKEFPCWDNGDHKGLHLKVDNEKPRGSTEAGAFFYSCKEAILTDPGTNSLQIGDGQVGFDCKASSKEMNKCESNCTVGMRSSQICMKQESCCLHPVPVQSTKRRKEDLWTCKDRSGKSAKSMDEDTNGRRSPHASESVFAPTSDAKQLEFYEDGGLFVFKADSRSLNNRSSREIDGHSYVADHSIARKPNMPEFNCDVIAVGESSEALCPDEIGVCSVGRVAKQDETSLKGQSLSEVSSKTVNVVMPLAGCGAENALVNMETEDGPEIDVAGNNAVATSLESPPPLGLPTVPELYNHVLQACNGDNSSSSVQPVVKLMGKEDDGNNKKPLLFQSSSDINDERIFSDSVLYPSKISGDTLTIPLSSHNKAQRGETGPVVHCGLRTDDANGSSVDEFHIKQETKVSSDYRETKSIIGFDAEQSKSDIIVLASQALLKMDSKAHFDDSKCEDAQIPDPNVGRTSISENKVAVTKGSHPPSTSERARDEEKHNLHKKMVIENEKNLSNSASKASYSGRSSQDSSKQVDPELKISGLNSSSKASFSRNISTNSSCGEANETFYQSKALYGQNKMSGSELVQRGEKLNHSNIQPSSKAIQNHAGSVLPSTGPSAPAMLSDEELALLLHQELNSSLRVPRVPRVRHASSLPQLASPSGSGLLIKRTSNSGGKDHIVVSRRKHKDTFKDEVCKSHEAEDDSKKLEKLLSSPDQRKPDVACIVDSSVKEEDHGSSTAHSVSRNLSFISTSTANSGPSSSPEDPRLSFTRGSPRMDGYSVGRVVHLTLPGLINEIMSKGRRMTYEELCNAVLPHWHNLRKHNGERYAYSSHSQAVLDCLRNRHEWARLVDRGPKTNFNRKRRKLEAEESDDNEWSKSRWAREEGMNLEYPKEEFPKGKRKARKRRRLALQGRGAVEDVRKRRKAYSSDEEAGPFSDSSEDGMFSDDETQGGGACPVGSNASFSSDEDGTSN